MQQFEGITQGHSIPRTLAACRHSLCKVACCAKQSTTSGTVFGCPNTWSSAFADETTASQHRVRKSKYDPALMFVGVRGDQVASTCILNSGGRSLLRCAWCHTSQGVSGVLMRSSESLREGGVYFKVSGPLASTPRQSPHRTSYEDVY